VESAWTPVAKALQLANGCGGALTGGEEQLFSSSMPARLRSGRAKLEPRSFSFNSAFGAVRNATGWLALRLDPAKVITDCQTAVGWRPGARSSSQYLLKLIHLPRPLQDRLEDSVRELPPRHSTCCLRAPKNEAPRTGFHGILTFLRDSIEEARSDGYREYMMNYIRPRPARVRGTAAAGVAGSKIAAFHRGLHRPAAEPALSGINLSFSGGNRSWRAHPARSRERSNSSAPWALPTSH